METNRFNPLVFTHNNQPIRPSGVKPKVL